MWYDPLKTHLSVRISSYDNFSAGKVHFAASSDTEGLIFALRCQENASQPFCWRRDIFYSKISGKSFAGCSRHDASRSAPLAGENELRNARRAGHSYDAFVMPPCGQRKSLRRRGAGLGEHLSAFGYQKIIKYRNDVVK